MYERIQRMFFRVLKPVQLNGANGGISSKVNDCVKYLRSHRPLALALSVVFVRRQKDLYEFLIAHCRGTLSHHFRGLELKPPRGWAPTAGVTAAIAMTTPGQGASRALRGTERVTNTTASAGRRADLGQGPARAPIHRRTQERPVWFSSRGRISALERRAPAPARPGPYRSRAEITHDNCIWLSS
ncbi:hypothetical protein EVAR_36940_1 [Eumeta japonica]|uniref:Uncharacterized protein n=1 Tax=Eumeta variegata TaxID=151549 RepID=A0A4C1X413_EUMVA|nr:hypothetical protein EVAR_36940_1 [Eumeta japonica]